MRPSFGFLILVTLSLYFSQTLQAEYLGKNDEDIDVFRIDMNDAPRDRFREVAIRYGDKVKALMLKYEKFFPSFVLEAFQYLDWGIWFFHYEKYEELEGICDIAGVDIHQALMVNYVYEFTSFCTSVIAKMQNGTIIHLRNLDFNFKDDMRNITYVAQFYRGDQYLFDAVMFGGLVGTFTGIKQGAFSISLNQRTPSDQWSLYDFLENFLLIFLSYNQPSWMIRNTLQQCHNYNCAYMKMTTEPVIAPHYLILAGTQDYEGTIITRDRMGVANVTNLTDTQWYLVQTNQDHYTGDCPIRCSSARQRFEEIGQANITVDTAYSQVLELWPNLNYLSIHSSVMVPSQSYFKSKFIYSYNDTDPGDL